MQTLVPLALAGLLIPALARGDTLNWDPNGTMGLSDNSGPWDQASQPWWDATTNQFTPWINGADAAIGAGTTLTGVNAPTITLDTAGPMVANSITFNAVGAGSTAGYTIVDGSGTGANALGVNTGNTMTITDNAAGVTTAINAPIVSNGAHPFTMNVLGTGNLSIGGSIGVSTGGNNGSGTLRVGSSPGTGYSGTLTVSAPNNLSAVNVNSGTLAVNNTASLGSGTVTLNGGTLSFTALSSNLPPIAMHVAAAANTTTAHNSMTASMSAAGVVPVAAGNWNNLQVARGTTPEKGYPGNGTITATNQQSTLPFTLNNGAGAATTAQVVNWWGSNTFAVAGTTTNNGTQQMFSSGFNANGSTTSFGSNQSSFTIDHIPYSSYNVFLYYFNNSAGAIGQAVLETGSSITAQPPASSSPTGIGLASMVTPTFANPNASYNTYFFSTGGGTAPTTYTQSTSTSSSSTPVSNYVEWTNVTGSSMFVGVQERSGGTPWIAGIEIVPTVTSVANAVAVSSSSTLDMALSVSLTGGTTITSSGSPTVLSVTGSGYTLDLSPSTTTFTGVGGTLSPASGATVKLGAIGATSGFGTAGAGNVVLSADNTSTLSGPVTIGGLTTLAMASTTSGSGTGIGPVTITSGGTLTGNGIVTPTGANTITVGSGGTVRAPASGTLRVNGTAAINGTAQSAAGSLIFAGPTTVNSGGNLSVGVGQLITASGGLTLAGGSSTFTVTSTGTTSPFVNVSGGAGPTSLGVTGSNAISILLSGAPNTTVGSTTTYDLFNYAGTDLAPTASGSMLTFSGGGTLTVSTPLSGGLPQADQLILVDIPGSGGGANQIQLQVTVPGPITWTGATNGNWNTTTTNWATATPTATQYVDGSTVTFADKNPLSPANNVTNTAITVQAAGVSPASISFTNTGATAGGVDFSFTGGTIGGASGGITLSGTGSVTFNNSNTYTGAVAVNAGRLILGNANALGSTSGVTVASGAALVLNNTSGNPTTFSTKASSGAIPLLIGGAGLTASPAGALDSIAGNNTYSGAITLSAATTINSASTAAGDGLTLGAIGTTASNFGLTFTGAGSTTVGGVISGGGSVTMSGGGTLALSGANTFTGGVQVNSGGTVVAKNNAALGPAANTVTVASGGALGLQGGISIGANPLTISGNGVAANPTGALNNVSGANAFAGVITLAAASTIGSSNSGDTLVLTGGVNTTASNYGLTFAGAGNTTVFGAIGGGGAVTMNGAGKLALGATNSYSGGTVINSGIVAVSNSNAALGTGGVTMAGGTLSFGGAPAIGLHIAADGGTSGSSSGEQPEQIGPSVTAGVVPINNWNDFIVTRFTNGGDRSNTNPPPAQSVPTSTTPFTLNNSAGVATTAQVTAWQSNNTFSTYGSPQTNPNAQLVNGFIGAINSGNSTSSPVTFPAKVTVSTVPMSGYNVYVYFNNNNAGQNTEISLSSGTYTSATYYVRTQGTAPLSGGNYTFTDGSASTAAGTYTPSNFVEIPVPAVGINGVGTDFTITLSSAVNGGNTPGIAAVEIVGTAGPTIANDINVTANSTLDVTAVATATAGNLSIGAQTLNVTGGSTGPGAPYTLTLGTTTLTGNATFNVNNNTTGGGNGLGSLRLGAVGDGGNGFGITVNSGNTAPGTVVLTAGGTYGGPTNINGGTLQVIGNVSGFGAVTVASGGTLLGPPAGNPGSSIAGVVTVQSGGTLAAFNNTILAPGSGVILAGGSNSSFNLSGTPSGDGGPMAMIATSGGGAPSSLTIGINSGDVHTVNLAGSPSPTPGSAVYQLISYTGVPLVSSGPSSGSTLAFTNAPGTLMLGSVPFGPFAYQLVSEAGAGPNGGGRINLAVTAYAMTWTGAQGASWDTTGQSQNFAALAPTPFAAAYVDGATVSFGDTNILSGNSPLGQQFPIVQSGGVRPASITFTNTGVANGGADYTFTNATNPMTNQPDTVGIAGSTGLTLNGNGSGLGGQVALNGANSFTGAVLVNAGNLVVGNTAALGSSAGVTVASGAELDLNTSGATATLGNAVNGSGKIPLTLTGTGLASSPSGALNNVSGNNTYAGPITLAGAATIASSADSLTLSGGIDTTATGYALTLVGASNTTVSGAITGAGSVTYNGGASAVLTLSAANNYSGGTTISSGLLSTKNAASLGTGPVTLSGGNLSFGGTTATIAISNPFVVTSNATIDVTGPTSVSIGTLQTGPATLAVTGGAAGAGTNYSLTTGAVTLNGDAEFDVSNNAGGTGAGTLRLGAVGDGGNNRGIIINNSGLASPGTVVLTAGGSYNGPTSVNAGALQVNGTVSGTGLVSVANFATLSGPVTSGGSGSLAGAVAVANGGTIAGTNGAILSPTGGLSLTSGSNSSFNLTGSPNGTANPAAAMIATGGGAGPRSLTTGATSGDTSIVNLTGTPFAQPGTWTYDLISYTGTPLSASPNSGTSLTFADGTVMALGAIPSGPYSSVQLVNNPAISGGQIDLQVTSYPITWIGGSGNVWDTTTTNWAYAPPSGTTSTNYVEGAYVTFADNSLFGTPVANIGGLATVNVQTSGVKPGAVAFTNVGVANSGVDYVLNGGSLGGAATVLTKTGAGTVTLNNANTYGGGTAISAGTVVAAQSTSLGTGPVTLAGGVLRLGTQFSGFGGNSSGNLSGTATWTVNNNNIASDPITNDVLKLTDNAVNEARSAFYNVPIPVIGGSSVFSAQFTYTPSGNKAADGIAFILQSSPSGTSALGGNGGNLGYNGGGVMKPSVAFEINLFTTNTVGVAWLSNGATGNPYTAVSGVNLASGDPIRVQLNYNQANTTLTAVLTDTTTNATATFSSSSLNVANILGSGPAYIGFSGGDGSQVSNQTVGSFSYNYASTAAYANDVVLSPSTTSTIDVAANTLASGYTLGNLTVGSGGASTLNVTASAALANQSYSLTFGSVALNSSANLNVASNGAGSGVVRVLGPVNDGGAGKSLTLSGPGTVNLAGNSSYSGGTTVSAGTLAMGLSNNPAGSGTITLAGGNLQLYGQTTGTPVAGLTTAFYNGPASLSTSSPSNDPNFATLSALQSFVGSNTPAAVSVSTAGGMTSLNWPSASNGKLFTAQGFTAATNYEAVIAGTVQIAQAGTYMFQTISDDGSMLYIDGSPTAQVSNNGNHGSTTVTSAPITLTAGVHSIVLGYFQGSGGAALQVNYKGPDTTGLFTAIPDTALLTSSAAAFPSATQTYTNNISVTSNATINVTGSLAATVGNLSLTGSTLSLASSDLSTTPYSLSVAGLHVTGSSGASVAASSSGGAGTLRITAPPTFAAGSSLNIAAGRVQFNVNTAGATVGAGATATVNSGATLELAGTASALASTGGKVNIVNNSSSSGVLVTGAGQVVGGIDGTGTTGVNGGSDLTANHIVQTALVIGGTAMASGLVTIDASDASGNPLAATPGSLSGTLPLAGTIPPDSPFTAGTSSGSSLAPSDTSSSTGALPVGSESSSAASSGGTPAVPEPSSILLLLAALAVAGVPLAKARSSRRKM